jgi:hypothetical protein
VAVGVGLGVFSILADGIVGGRLVDTLGLGLGVDRHTVVAPVLLGDRLAERRDPPRDRVLVVVLGDRASRRLLDLRRRGEVREP